MFCRFRVVGKNMKKITSLIAVMLLWGGLACAQKATETIPTTQSAAAGDLVLPGLNFYGVVVNWQSATTARYFMVFDATALPSNGAVAGCSAGWTTGCLLFCQYMSNSGSAPGAYQVDYTAHPFAAKFGLVEAVLTGAGCATLTVDGSNDFFYTQVR